LLPEEHLGQAGGQSGIIGLLLKLRLIEGNSAVVVAVEKGLVRF
jgi:hypothetical protein